MRDQEPHLPDKDLLLEADGELPQHERERVRAHLDSCWTCRARMRDIDNAIVDFVHVRNELMPPLPPVDGPRALLRLRLGHLAESSRPALLAQTVAVLRSRNLRIAWSVCLGLVVAIAVWRSGRPVADPHVRMAELRIRSAPDPRLTPGSTLPLTRDNLCAAGMVESARVVPVDVANRVFAAYGVNAPEPRTYEVDYLITPALGGSDDIHNFWPQPYRNTVWNAHIKDALEDRLRDLVCSGHLELATAQHELAADWISAYKKYFHTEVPLADHASFLKDRPWE